MLIAMPDLENKKNMSSRIVWKVGAPNWEEVLQI